MGHVEALQKFHVVFLGRCLRPELFLDPWKNVTGCQGLLLRGTVMHNTTEPTEVSVRFAERPKADFSSSTPSVDPIDLEVVYRLYAEAEIAVLADRESRTPLLDSVGDVYEPIKVKWDCGHQYNFPTPRGAALGTITEEAIGCGGHGAQVVMDWCGCVE